MGYVALPAFRAPAPLDWSPLERGVADYKEGQTRNALFQHQVSREKKEDARTAVADSRAATTFGQQQEQYAAGKQDRAAKALASALQSISSLPPEQQGGAYNTLRTSVKDFDTDVKGLGGNPDDMGDAIRRVTSHVEGYISRADQAGIDKDKAQTELARAQAQNEQYKPVTDETVGLYSTRDGSVKPLGLPGPDGSAAPAGVMTKPKDIFNGEKATREEFNAIHKDFRTVRDSYASLKTAATNPTPAGDMGVVYALMKIYDPTSVVRESEFATAENVGSVPTRIWTQYNKALTGQRLADDVRADFLAQARKAYVAREETYKRSRDQYIELAKRQHLDPANVVIDQELPADGPTKVEGSPSSFAGAQPAGAPMPSPTAPPAPAQGAAPAPQPAATQQAAPGAQPPPPPRQAPDGLFYIPDPQRPGKFLRVDP